MTVRYDDDDDAMMCNDDEQQKYEDTRRDVLNGLVCISWKKAPNPISNYVSMPRLLQQPPIRPS